VRLPARRRGYGDYAGWWEFPGGKVEPGEDPEDALRREIREELAVDISISRYFGRTEYDYESFYLVMECYLCLLAPDEEISLLEHRAAEWVGAERARTLKWLAADIPLVEKLIGQKVVRD
jgi:8-oxo-dGTP diphosphatase